MIKSFRKKDGSHVIYCKPMVASFNFKTGKSKPIEITEKEEAQYMYDSICSDQRREDFDKNILSLITNYEGEDRMKDWDSVEINIKGENINCQLNIYNTKKRMKQFIDMILPNK